MALGAGYASQRRQAHFGAISAMTQGVPPTPVSIIDPEPLVEYRRETCFAALEPTPLGDGPVATLAAPAPDQRFVLERVVISNFPAVGQIWLCIDKVDSSRLVDFADTPVATLLVSADPQPIVLLPTEKLKVAWIGADPQYLAFYVAQFQIRVEEL